MAEFLIALYGEPPSFDHRKGGEPRALIEVEGGTSAYELDPERDRVRIESIPSARDLDKWISAGSLLASARRGAWGLRAVEDRYPIVPEPGDFVRRSFLHLHTGTKGRAHREPVKNSGRFARTCLPRDLCSCLRCRDVVLVRRSSLNGKVMRIDSPGRCYRKAVICCAGLSPVQGPGQAGVIHGRNCHSWDLAAIGRTPPKPDRSRGKILGQLLSALQSDPLGRLLLAPK